MDFPSRRSKETQMTAQKIVEEATQVQFLRCLLVLVLGAKQLLKLNLLKYMFLV